LYRGTESLPLEAPEPWYAPFMAGWRPIVSPLPTVDPALYRTFEYTTPIVDMTLYLPWLANQVRRLGGTIVRRRLTLLSDLGSNECDIIVNCAGLGARWLVPDTTVIPKLGVIAVVARPAAQALLDPTVGHQFHRISLRDGEVAYIYPRRDCICLGGTYLPLANLTDPDAWRSALDAPTAAAHAQAIIERCALLQPDISACPLLRVRWGARPYRPTVRCEFDASSQCPLVLHHYGHGGQGVLLSWGSSRHASRALWSRLIGPQAEALARVAPYQAWPSVSSKL
jgi:D-amino-acid oxidase